MLGNKEKYELDIVVGKVVLFLDQSYYLADSFRAALSLKVVCFISSKFL